MAMSRKHYREAADAIKSAMPVERPKTVRAKVRAEVCKEIADSLANMFKSDASKFDRQRFMEACGLDD